MTNILRILICAGLLLALPMSTCAADKPGFRVIELWPNGAPGATGTSEEDKPAIIPVLPDVAKRTGAAILICPGGGFMTRATDFEGVLVAQWLRERGIAAFILRYRIRPLYGRKDWLLDAQRAMQHIRANAAGFQVAPNRIGILGFSAGADLAYDASLNPLPAKPDAVDPVERIPSRPDFQVLVYGASPQRPATEPARLAALPPAFLFCTVEDDSHVHGMVDLYRDMLRARVPAEAHFFLNGEHGVGFALGDPVLGEYPHLMARWLAGNGFLTGQPRLALTGNIKLDGAPLVRGIVVLTPIDQIGAPPVVAYITNTGTGPLGNFTVSPRQGPVAGRYRVEVRLDSTRWRSNSRDPVMIRMMDKQRAGTLTDEDRREWGEYIRKRDLSPSIDGQRIFRRQRPRDKSDYIVEIKDGGNPLALEVFSR
ncbi:MAG: alpha/beta hydrolase [Blastocatellia bacterium]|nr:alpha/beta hydrolase [Blastocatellia bacterium]